MRKLRQMFFDGHHVSRAMYVMAELGMAHLLREGARDSGDLAQSTKSHSPTLYRVLRFLAAHGILSEIARRRFALTELGAALRSDVHGSARPQIRYLLNDFHWQTWDRLLEAVRTGVTPFGQIYGMASIDYLATSGGGQSNIRRRPESSARRARARVGIEVVAGNVALDQLAAASRWPAAGQVLESSVGGGR